MEFANAAKTSCKKSKSGLKCGAAACEYDWTGIKGTKVRDLTKISRFPDRPNAMLALTDAKKNKSKRFQLVRKGDNLGAMLEGFVVAPDTASYVFIVRSDDSSEVWAAPTPRTMADLKKVVELRGCCRTVYGWGSRLSWNKGEPYYIKALVKEGGGGEYLYVGFRTSRTYYPSPSACSQMSQLNASAPMVSQRQARLAQRSGLPGASAATPALRIPKRAALRFHRASAAVTPSVNMIGTTSKAPTSRILPSRRSSLIAPTRFLL
jgi:hypothetical protein